MRVELRRHWYSPTATIGTLRVGETECYSIELPWKNNERGISCIPQGTYPMVLEHSLRFNRKLWELKNVPNRSEVKLHPANVASQLEGCIAPGLQLGVMQSGTALDALMKVLAALPAGEPVEIVITGPAESFGVGPQ